MSYWEPYTLSIPNERAANNTFLFQVLATTIAYSIVVIQFQQSEGAVSEDIVLH